MEFLYIIIAIYLVCGIIYNVVKHKANKKCENKKARFSTERVKSKHIQIENCEKEIETKMSEKPMPQKQYGVIVKQLYPGVTLYEKGLVINDIGYALNEIVGCEIRDPKGEWAEELGLSGEKVTTSTKSIIGRAVVGGVVAGPVGTVIGGATAKKNVKKVSYGHNYVVNIITLNNKYGNAKIVVGEHYENALEIKAIIDSIILNNQK